MKKTVGGDEELKKIKSCEQLKIKTLRSKTTEYKVRLFNQD